MPAIPRISETAWEVMKVIWAHAPLTANDVILEDRGALRERIQAIASFRRPGRWAGVAVVLVAGVAIAGLTDATEREVTSSLPAAIENGSAGSRSGAADVLIPSVHAVVDDKTGPGTSSEEERLWGTVYLDGRPLEGAYVSYYDHIRRMGGAGRTDAQGRIFVYPNPKAQRLVVWFDPFQAVLDASRLTNEFRAELGNARGRVTGTLWRGDQPWAGKELTLGRRWPGLIEPSYHPANRTNQAFRIPATTDAQGRFEFRNVACGLWAVRSRHVEWGEVEVRPGAVVVAGLGRGGAAIVGRVVSDDPTFKTDWRNAHVSVIGQDRGPQPWLPHEVESDWWYMVEQVLPAERVPAKWRWLPGEVEADGSFVVPEVPPGDHVLTVVLSTERAMGANPFPVEIGASPRITVSVPPVGPHTPRVIEIGTVPLRRHHRNASSSTDPRVRAAVAW